MAITDPSWRHPDPTRSRIRLDVVPSDVIHGLARGEASAESVSPYLAGPEFRGLWRIRSAQIAARPADAPWVTRFIITPEVSAPIGVAGFHGGPDESGMVEVGYSVDPGWRRRGCARSALEILIAEARSHPSVRTIRATIAPDNLASIELVTAYGFTENGEQWDEEDGREIIYEIAAA
ncbi:GNAT family N-acetyltransferase [Microbacterium oleivorans]|uniref:GNAT family N-acetyltransferase n=1 Tax=Microbacterium oleivorans TaxID=273677 RepID=UPI0009EF4EFD|nr:GNAT family N-acetyltransferase [Microbacterium oleivorans]